MACSQNLLPFLSLSKPKLPRRVSTIKPGSASVTKAVAEELFFNHDGFVTRKLKIELADPLENLGVKLVRQVGAKTNDLAGDGSTTFIVLARGLIAEGLKVGNCSRTWLLLRQLQNLEGGGKRGRDKPLIFLVIFKNKNWDDRTQAK